MRFVITGEWNRNRLLQTIVVLYSLYVIGLWITNALLFFHKMSLTPASVVAYYLGDEEKFLSPRSYQGLTRVDVDVVRGEFAAETGSDEQAARVEVTGWAGAHPGRGPFRWTRRFAR